MRSVQIDFLTLFVATGFVTEVAGLLLLFSWLQDRRSTTLVYWGAGYIIAGIGGILFAARGSLPIYIAITVGGTITMAAFGLMWSGARSFEGRRPNVPLALAGAVIWALLATGGFFDSHIYFRIVVATLIIVSYLLLTVGEFWFARDKELVSRWPAMILLLMQAGFFIIRLMFAERLPFPGGVTHFQPGLLPYGIFVLLLNNFCLAFLVMNMTKERLELDQRRLALVDPLTGVANRRAFLDRGDRAMRRAFHDKRPAALLLLDLDFFKQINDTFGHQAGDQVLRDFCEVAGSALRPDDMFGRLGGEEFACLLPGITAAEAALVAERIRMRFADYAMPNGTTGFHFSVSIGIAMAADAEYALTAMLANADRALYQAKSKGRNRVERAWPSSQTPGFAAAVA
jgi:diguanylate cyclase (GGDEF)-like protein